MFSGPQGLLKGGCPTLPALTAHARRGAAVVVDDGIDAAVVGGHSAQVGGRQPTERDARHPPSVVEQLVEHLVVGRAAVGSILHGLGPRGQ
eukprot:scaffold53844_cov66-Phaeocystis_antarctica.AAC.1